MLCRNNKQDELTLRHFLWKYTPFKQKTIWHWIFYTLFFTNNWLQKLRISITDYRNYEFHSMFYNSLNSYKLFIKNIFNNLFNYMIYQIPSFLFFVERIKWGDCFHIKIIYWTRWQIHHWCHIPIFDKHTES